MNSIKTVCIFLLQRIETERSYQRSVLNQGDQQLRLFVCDPTCRKFCKSQTQQARCLNEKTKSSGTFNRLNKMRRSGGMINLFFRHNGHDKIVSMRTMNGFMCARVISGQGSKIKAKERWGVISKERMSWDRKPFISS